MINGLLSLLRACEAVNFPATAQDIADALWLAQWRTIAAEPARAPEPEPPELEPDPPLVREKAPELPGSGAAPLPPELPENKPELEEEAPDEADAPPVDVSLPPASGKGNRAGRPFGAAAAPALSNPLALSRALRPIVRRAPSRTRFVLDEDATIRRFTEQRLLIPVMRPARQRWLRLVLVVDGGVGGDLWRDTIREFRALLTNIGAFRDVRLWSLNADTPIPHVAPWGRRVARAADKRDELTDPSGGTLTVVMSPFVASGWRDGSAGRVLNRWAAHGAVVLIPLLPERLWARTALADTTPVRIAAAGPGVANARLSCTQPDEFFFSPDVEGTSLPTVREIALPLAVLEPDSLRRWANVLAGRPGAIVPGVLYPQTPSPPHPALTSASPAPLAVGRVERVERFRQTASALAVRLARLLAASPVSLSVLRLIRRTLLPEASQQHEAEVLFGGLLRRTSDANAADPRFDFHEGVRECLLDATRPEDSFAVMEAVSEYLGEHLASVKTFKAILADPTAAAGELSAEGDEFAKVAVEVLLRAGGAYARRVRRTPPKSAPQAAAPGSTVSFQQALTRVRRPAEPSTPVPQSGEAPAAPTDQTRAEWPPEEIGSEAEQSFPRQFGRYDLLGLLGTGGMGVVYRARPLAGGAEVALKTPAHRIANDPIMRERFRREYSALVRLRHWGIVQALEFGEYGGSLYFTMPILEGLPLDAVRRTSAESAGLVAEVADAMQQAHDAGIVHRNLKPTNIIVRPSGRTVLIDFGIALVLDQSTGHELGPAELDAIPDFNRWWPRSDFIDERLTQFGQAMGTPAYMSPEQWRGDSLAIGPRSDVFALGAVLYKLITGEQAFQGSGLAVMNRVVEGEVKPPTELAPGLDAEISSITLRALAKDPAERWASMAEFSAALREFAARSERPKQHRLAQSASSRPQLPGQAVLEFLLVPLRDAFASASASMHQSVRDAYAASAPSGWELVKKQSDLTQTVVGYCQDLARAPLQNGTSPLLAFVQALVPLLPAAHTRPLRRAIRAAAERLGEATSPPSPPVRTLAALVIGVGYYSHTGIAPPRYAVDDATAVAEKLIAGCGFPQDRVRLLTDRNARRDTIVEAFEPWLVDQARGAELVFIYFAGHSQVESRGGEPEGYMLPHDADPNNPAARGIALADLTRWVSNLEARNVVVCLDCCHRGLSHASVSPELLRKVVTRRGVYVLTSCAAGQISVEDDDEQRGLFTRCLLAGIDGAGDRDRDGRVGLDELLQYVTEAVPVEARRFGAEQQPWTAMKRIPGAAISAVRIRSDAPAPRVELSADEVAQWLKASPTDAEAVELLRRAAALANPRLTAVVVPRLAAGGAKAVRDAATAALKAIGTRAAFEEIENLARRNDPALDSILNGLAALIAREDLVALLSKVVDLSSGEVRAKAEALYERKRLPR